MNPLDQYPNLRRAMYLAQWIVNLVLGAIGVALLVLEQSPMWFVLASAVFNFVWTYAGVTAQGNVTPMPVQPVAIVDEHDPDHEFHSAADDENGPLIQLGEDGSGRMKGE